MLTALLVIVACLSRRGRCGDAVRPTLNPEAAAFCPDCYRRKTQTPDSQCTSGAHVAPAPVVVKPRVWWVPGR